MQKVQNAIARDEVKDLQTLKTNARIEYSTYNQILECRDGDFIIHPDGTFNCIIYLNFSVRVDLKCSHHSQKMITIGGDEYISWLDYNEYLMFIDD